MENDYKVVNKKAVGNSIHVDDSVDASVVDLRLIGQSVQDGVPSPEEPKEIQVFGEKREDGKFDVSVKTCGKNLADKSKFLLNTTIVTGTGGTNSVGDVLTTNFIKVKPNTTYSVSHLNTNGYVWEYDKDKKPLRRVADPKPQANSTYSYFTTGENCHYIRGATSSNNIDRVQVEEGSVQTEYEPYQETIATLTLDSPLCGLPVESGNGNYIDENGQEWFCDILERKENGRWDIIRRCGYQIFDGSRDEQWNSTVTSGNDGHYYMRAASLVDIIKLPISGEKANILCSSYDILTASDVINDLMEGIFITVTGGVGVYDSKYDINSAESFKEYLSNDPITVVYELAVPTTESLTEDQVTELTKLQTFEPITNITTNATAGLMEVTYKTPNPELKGLITDKVLSRFYTNLKEQKYLLDEMSDEDVDKMMGLKEPENKE